MTRPFSKWALLALLFVGLLVADQWTKFLAVERLTVVFERGGDAGLAEKVRGF
jgi:signal peptidase II